MLSPRNAIETLHEYHPPLGQRSGLRLDFNENTVGPSPAVLKRLRELTLEDLARYPAREPVEAEIAAFLKLRPEEVLLTNGVDEAIHLLCETYLEAGDEAIIVVPTFAMYEINAAATGSTVIRIPAGEGFAFPFDAVLRSITSRTRLVAIANPNNPTGTLATASCLLQIADSAPEAAILVDEAYYEFCGQTLLASIRERTNLFVARTFSKAYGLAGLRAGILAGPSAQMRMVRRSVSPYNVNAIALLALPEALRDTEYVCRYVGQVQRGRAALEEECRSRGISFCPSQANFVLLRVGTSHGAFVEAMRDRGILVRDRSSDEGCDGWVRITLGSEDHTVQLLKVLGEVLLQLKIGDEVAK